MHTLRWVIVGPGNIAESFIKDLALIKTSKNRVVGVMSDKREEAATFSQRYGIPNFYDDLPKMLREVHPQVAYIATPHPSHYKTTLFCIRQGCAVLCEKPLALNAKEAGKLIDAARQQKVFLMEGMWIRFLPSILKVKELIEKKAIGNIKNIIADMSYVAPRDQSNRFYNPQLGGGSLLDLGIYPVYLSLLIFGIPHEIKAVAKLNGNKIDESCTLSFQYNEGQFALLASSIKTDTSRTAQIRGDKGKITLLKPWNEKPKAIKLSVANQKERAFSCRWPGRGFQYEIEEVIRCLREGKIESDLHSHAHSMALIHTLDKIRKKKGIHYPKGERL